MKNRYSLIEKVLLGLVVASMPLTAVWTRPFGPFKLAELSAICLIIVFGLKNSTESIDITPAGPYLFTFLIVSCFSLVRFLFTNQIPEFVYGYEWASGFRRPPLYNLAIIARQFTMIGLFFAAVNILREKRTTYRLIRVHLITATAVAALGITQFVAYYILNVSWGVYPWIVPRVMGTTPEPAPFGVYLLSAIPILLVQFTEGASDIFSRRNSAVCLTILVVAELLTFSVQAWGILAVVICLVLIQYLSLSHVVRLGAVIAIPFVLVGVLVPGALHFISDLFIAKLNVYLGGQFSATASGGRIAGLYIGPRIIADHPLFGVGTGNYPVLRNLPRYLGNIRKATWLDLPANHYMQLLIETGLLGFIPFMIGICKLLREIFAGAWHTTGREYRIIVGAGLATLGLFADLIVSSALWFSYMWILPAFAYAVGHSDRKPTSSEVT